MKLTEKDKEFLERLRELIDAGDLWVERTVETPSRFILRGNDGNQIEERFRLSRQGVRWRFWRLLNDIYVSSYETVLFVEKHLGTQFRKDALQIAHDRWLLRQEALKNLSFQEANRYRSKDENRA